MQVENSIRLSPSEIIDWVRCPRRQTHKVLNAGRKRQRGFSHDVAQAFGIIVDDLIAGRPMPSDSDLDRVVFDQHTRDREDLKRQASQMAKLMATILRERSIGAKWHNQQKLGVTFGGATSVEVNGVADLITEKDGQIEIWDIKTGTDARVAAANWPQLSAYAYAWHNQHGEYPAKVGMVFGERGRRVFTHQTKVIRTFQSEGKKMADEFMSYVKLVARFVSAEPPAFPGRHCDSCMNTDCLMNTVSLGTR